MASSLSRTSRRTARRDTPKLQTCPPHELLTRLGDTWTILVLVALSRAHGNRLRFSDLKSGIEGISQRMLTVTLRALERDGLLIRDFFAEVPPRVEYQLTGLGRSILPAMEGLTGWIREHWPMIEQSRQLYDDRPQRRRLISP